MSSSISLLPTIEFLDQIARQQWRSDVDYAIGFSTHPPRFFSTTNSEWLGLNSESELLSSKFGTVAIGSDFNYTRPESSPVLIASNDLKSPQQKAQSIFLYRSDGETEEIIFNANFTKNQKNQTTAPLLDCFSRECLSWFSSSVDWYYGVGSLSSSLSLINSKEDNLILTSSKDILSSIVSSSSKISTDLFEILENPSSTSPYSLICIGSGISYQGEEVNTLFLYSVEEDDSLVAFASEFNNSQTSVDYAFMEIEISFTSEIIFI